MDTSHQNIDAIITTISTLAKVLETKGLDKKTLSKLLEDDSIRQLFMSMLKQMAQKEAGDDSKIVVIINENHEHHEHYDYHPRPYPLPNPYVNPYVWPYINEPYKITWGPITTITAGASNNTISYSVGVDNSNGPDMTATTIINLLS